MPGRNRILISGVVVVICALLLIAFAPLLVSKGVRLWVWWKTRGTNVTVKIDTIEAPFLRPITVRGVRVQTTSPAAVRLDLTAARVVFGLNLRSILMRTRGRTLTSLLAQEVHVEVRRNKTGTPFSETAWNTVQRLLPDKFELQSLDVRLESESTLAFLRGVSLTGTPIEAGRFQAAEVVISSPMFRQTFSNLRGATDWQGDRLTIAALTLTRGLDVQSITTDLSHLGKRRISLDFDVDAFGGKLRGSVADEWRSHRSNWNIAGSAGDISLSQTAEAFGFTDRVGGLVHAGKFTFRGDLTDALTGTASAWVELTGPAWRDREADVIMLGVSLYGRQLELQQLYIKQKKNELTLNGESSFPTTVAGWLSPDFRGNVSASIDDLGEFASLFGGNRNDFAGRVEVDGTFNARDRNVGGNLVASGSGLTMFKRSIDQFHTTLNVKRDEIEVVQMEFKRNNDLLHVQGKIATSAEHSYSGAIDVTVGNVGDYLSLRRGQSHVGPISATLHANVTASVWEARAVLDPAESKPIDISVTFPLRIGQPADAIWNSPITATIDIPGLFLAEIPHNESAMRFFDSGMATGQLTITETLRHPRIMGYAQISGGVMGSTDIDTRIRFEGSRATIENLKVGDKQHNASFFGDVDLQDAQHLTVNLSPNQPIYDLSSPILDCVGGIAIAPNNVAFDNWRIEAVDISGGIGASDWVLKLKQSTAGLAPGFESPILTKTFRFCPEPIAPAPSLTIGVQPPVAPSPPPQPVRQRKRKR